MASTKGIEMASAYIRIMRWNNFIRIKMNHLNEKRGILLIAVIMNGSLHSLAV